jgi:hypothetical protein
MVHWSNAHEASWGEASENRITSYRRGNLSVLIRNIKNKTDLSHHSYRLRGDEPKQAPRRHNDTS